PEQGPGGKHGRGSGPADVPGTPERNRVSPRSLAAFGGLAGRTGLISLSPVPLCLWRVCGADWPDGLATGDLVGGRDRARRLAPRVAAGGRAPPVPLARPARPP